MVRSMCVYVQGMMITGSKISTAQANEARERKAMKRTYLPHPTSVNAESTFNPLPSHRFLDASRRYPVREVVDFWEGLNPGPGSIEEEAVSATEERADWGWGWETRPGLFGALSVHPISNQKADIHSLPAMTATLPLPASSGAFEIAARPGVHPENVTM